MMLTLKRLAILVFVVSLTACHYRVTDPETGHVYYTDNIKRYGQSGAIGFKDMLTGQNVTLDSSEYEELSQKEFNLHLLKEAQKDEAQKDE